MTINTNKRIKINTPTQNKISCLSSFFASAKSIYFTLILIVLLHLFWAWQWPLLNDESYYWDWSRNLQLSYVDAPPAISWVAYLGTKLFSGKLGARFAVPILNLLTTIFLIRCAALLQPMSSRGLTAGPSSWIVILLFFSIPIFNMNGILLMPDAPLLFACAGSLYFALKSCKKMLTPNNKSSYLLDACALGLFIGLCISSKYQGVPLAIGIFLAIFTIRGLHTTFTKDLLFWMMTVIFALMASSPLFIWNLQNNFASFRFQGQHGFSEWHLNILSFSLYMLSVFAILIPWFSYLFTKQIIISFKKSRCFKSLDCIPIFAFFSIFIFIGFAALGKSTQVHWITPSALFLIPLVAANWNTLTAQSPRFWKYMSVFSVILIVIITTGVFTRPVQTFLSQDKIIFGYKIRNIHKGLYGNLLWSNLANAQTNIQKSVPQIALAEKKYFYSAAETQCTQEPYLGAFNWRWTSQFAFYLDNQPRVFSFDLKRSTYYSWRDSLEYFAGCQFFVLGPESMYNAETLAKIMDIKAVTKFIIPQDYTNLNIHMVLIEGTLKDQETLKKASKNLIENITY